MVAGRATNNLGHKPLAAHAQTPLAVQTEQLAASLKSLDEAVDICMKLPAVSAPPLRAHCSCTAMADRASAECASARAEHVVSAPGMMASDPCAAETSAVRQLHSVLRGQGEACAALEAQLAVARSELAALHPRHDAPPGKQEVANSGAALALTGLGPSDVEQARAPLQTLDSSDQPNAAVPSAADSLLSASARPHAVTEQAATLAQPQVVAASSMAAVQVKASMRSALAKRANDEGVAHGSSCSARQSLAQRSLGNC